MTWRMYTLAGVLVPAMIAAQTAAPTPPPSPSRDAAQSTTQPTPATTNAPVPVETFAKLPGIENPKMSPDGTRIAAKMAIGGQQVLVVAPLFPGGKVAAVKVGATVDINWWRWVGDDWLAVGVGSQDVLYGEDIYVTRTLGVKADMTKVNRIDWTHSGVRADEVCGRHATARRASCCPDRPASRAKANGIRRSPRSICRPAGRRPLPAAKAMSSTGMPMARASSGWAIATTTIRERKPCSTAVRTAIRSR